MKTENSEGDMRPAFSDKIIMCSVGLRFMTADERICCLAASLLVGQCHLCTTRYVECIQKPTKSQLSLTHLWPTFPLQKVLVYLQLLLCNPHQNLSNSVKLHGG